MESISLGKFRSLTQVSTKNQAISILALDHRNNLRNALNPNAPETVKDEEMMAFKQQVVKYVSPASSAVLLDPEVGALQCIAAGVLPGKVGLLCAIEATGYTGDPLARKSAILPGWSVEKARRLGAAAVKLLVYYHPDGSSAPEIEDLVAKTAADCNRYEIPLFLEPLSYSLDPSVKKLSSVEKRRVVIDTAQRLTPLGVDILKAEFPLDVSAEKDETIWAAACRELSSASKTPWILLSASVDYETYLRQVEIACVNGASGVAAGRAVWKEAPEMEGFTRESFLIGKAAERMERLSEVCDALAKPWTDFYSSRSVDAEGYQSY